MTIVIVACSVVGVIKCVPLGRRLSLWGRVAAVLLFAALQLVSFLEPIANR